MTTHDADQRLDHVRKLRIRLLGDRVLQNVAWTVADQLGWSDTFDAEYVALTQLQADALVTLDTTVDEIGSFSPEPGRCGVTGTARIRSRSTCCRV